MVVDVETAADVFTVTAGAGELLPSVRYPEHRGVARVVVKRRKGHYRVGLVNASEAVTEG